MTLKANYELMADYNQWMNENIYSFASQLNSSELTEDRGAFFGSVIGTLNHIFVGDTIWLKRFAGHPAALKSLDYVRKMDSPKSLDSIIHSELSDLHQSRIKLDRVICEFAGELTDSILATNLSYKNTKGRPFNKRFAALIQHFFNHQTHHRGQVSTLFNQFGIDIGVTDLLARIPDCEA